MSTLLIERKPIDNVRPHPKADRLELATIGGWQLCVPKGQYRAGQEVVYVPPDSVLPPILSDKLGVTNYLNKGRVKCVKLRGEPSFGLVIDPEPGTPDDGLAEFYGITKYVPQSNPQPGWGGGGPAGKAASLPEVEGFPRYTDIENLRHYPTAFEDGEYVIATEKIHGTCVRVGIVGGEWMAGSRKIRRAVPMVRKGPIGRLMDWLRGRKPTIDTATSAGCWFTFPLSLDSVRDLLQYLSRGGNRDVVLFGEVYGKVQGLTYAQDGLAFRAFDVMVAGEYVSHGSLEALCDDFYLPSAPIIYEGPYSYEKIKEVSEGQSTLPGVTHLREGVVVRPISERRDPRVGRLVLKMVSDEYLLGPQSEDEAASE